MAGPPILVVLAPHPDDAVLAVGGLLTRHTKRGGRAVIVTVFAGSPPNNMSPIARHLYANHLQRDEIPRIRRREDLAASHQVHAEVVQLAHLDALYRTGPDGALLYTDLEQIFAASAAEVESTSEHLARQFVADGLLPAHAEVLAPLGVVGHVDHWIVRRAIELARDRACVAPFRVHYYEDQPYASRRHQHSWQYLTPPFGVPTVHPLTDTEWQIKIDAVACHASQITLLWPDGRSFPDELRAYAKTIGGVELAERTWSPGSPVRTS